VEGYTNSGYSYNDRLLAFWEQMYSSLYRNDHNIYSINWMPQMVPSLTITSSVDFHGVWNTTWQI